MLYLIGLGLNDERDLTLKAVDIAKKCDCYIEMYTSHWHGSLRNLESIVGREIKVLKRKDLEEGLEDIMREAKEKDVAIFVGGDPLAATTHIDLLIVAKRRKIPYRVIHNASIFSAIGESGLQLYKFGKVATVPFTQQLDNVKDALKKNKKLGLHTLLLLDVDSEVSLYMTVADALKILTKSKILKNADRIIALSRLGSENPGIKYDSVKWLVNSKFETPSVIVVPGKLHFQEKEFLDSL